MISSGGAVHEGFLIQLVKYKPLGQNRQLLQSVMTRRICFSKIFPSVSAQFIVYTYSFITVQFLTPVFVYPVGYVQIWEGCDRSSDIQNYLEFLFRGDLSSAYAQMADSHRSVSITSLQRQWSKCNVVLYNFYNKFYQRSLRVVTGGDIYQQKSVLESVNL